MAAAGYFSGKCANRWPTPRRHPRGVLCAVPLPTQQRKSACKSLLTLRAQRETDKKDRRQVQSKIRAATIVRALIATRSAVPGTCIVKQRPPAQCVAGTRHTLSLSMCQPWPLMHRIGDSNNCLNLGSVINNDCETIMFWRGY